MIRNRKIKQKSFYKMFLITFSFVSVIAISSCSNNNFQMQPNNDIPYEPKEPETNKTKEPSVEPMPPKTQKLPTKKESEPKQPEQSNPQTPKQQPEGEKTKNPENETNSKYSYKVSSNSPNFRFAVPQYNPTTGEEFVFPEARNRPPLDNGIDEKGQKIPVTYPQMGYSPNKHYEKNFRTSFNLVFQNQEKNKENSSYSTERGTGWILDYQKTNDDSYPTIWYIATNAHVADKLHSKNNYAPYDDFEKNQLETTNFQLIKWNPPEEGYKRYRWDENYALRKVYETGNTKNTNSGRNFPIKAIPRTVFVGTDFLETNPKQYSKKLFDEELIDFAVIEVEFSSPKIAKEITSNYANWEEQEKNKFLQTSYLKDPSQIKPNIFYLAGFPGEIPTINRITMGSENSDLPDWREEDTQENRELRDRGSSLGNWEYLSTFEPNAPKGIGDATLFLPYFWIEYRGKKYTPAGLTYAIKNSNLVGGSSGSKVTNANGEIVSIHAIGYKDENTSSISFALKSEGFDQPEYKTYKTPAYDIIYGGFKGQKKSYYQAMQEIYKNKPGKITHLFNNWNEVFNK